MGKKVILLGCLAIIASLSAIPVEKAVAAQPRYTYIDVVRNNTNPAVVDDRGLAVGQTQFSNPGVWNAFLWNKTNGSMKNLGGLRKLGGLLADLDRSQALGISAYGGDRCGDRQDQDCDRNRRSDDRDRCGDGQDQDCDRNRRSDDRDRCGDDWDRRDCQDSSITGVTVVGQSWNLDWDIGGPNARARAFLWDSQKGMMDLGTLGGSYSSAYSINTRGWVVGYAETSSTGTFSALYWDETRTPHPLDNREQTYSSAYAINDRNQIVGIIETDTPSIFHGFLWQADLGMRDLAPLPGGTFSVANYLNQTDICGCSDDAAGNLRAVLWQMNNLGVSDLGDLGGDYSAALGMNNAGQVVGQAATAIGDDHAFIWTKGVGMEDLNLLVAGLPPNVTLTYANSINNKGEIWVQAEGPDEYMHTFLLVPFSGRAGSGGGGGIDRDNCSDRNHRGDRDRKVKTRHRGREVVPAGFSYRH